jgi:hypothetical protein
MSQGNLGCAIGLANTNKVPAIGGYFQGGTPPPGWSASDNYLGVNGSTYYNRNVIDEDYTVSGGITVNGNSGTATGKAARWVSNTASLTVGADQTIAVSAGGVATAGTAAAYKTPFAVGTVIPANSFFWVFTV